ncbi:MAG: outer membrane protein assembly factor BamB [Verrucomicrobiales bacterium]|jgi:outer membrane protein assembly factor BamB
MASVVFWLAKIGNDRYITTENESIATFVLMTSIAKVITSLRSRVRSATVCFSLLSLVTAWLPSAAAAEEWSRFRGPNGTGISDSTTIPFEISKKDINWSIKVKGIGHSSPVVHGGKIFLTSVATKGGNRYVLCYNTAGKKLWEYEAPFKTHSLHRFNTFASSTPAVDGKQLYVSWTTGDRHEVIALDHDGKLVWEKDLGFFAEDHGSSASPVVYNKTLLVGNDHAAQGGGYLAGLDCATGEEKWKVKRSAVKASFSTPTLFKPENGPMQAIFSSNPMALTAVEAETGKVVWEYPGNFRKDIRTVASPVVTHGIVFASAGSGGSGKAGIAVRINGTGGKPELAWDMIKGLPYVPTPVAKDDYLFLMGDNGTMSCVNASTGEVLWKERVTGETYSSPVCINGRIYCISRQGEMAVVAATPEFKKLAEYDFESPIHASPAVADSRLYIRTEDRLLSIGSYVKNEVAE